MGTSWGGSCRSRSASSAIFSSRARVSRTAADVATRSASCGNLALFSPIGPPQGFEVELLHGEHRRHYPLGLGGILVLQHALQLRGRHLPGKPELVGEPAADAFTASRRELGPVFVDLLLVFAVHHEGDRFIELEFGSTIESQALLR